MARPIGYRRDRLDDARAFVETVRRDHPELLGRHGGAAPKSAAEMRPEYVLRLANRWHRDALDGRPYGSVQEHRRGQAPEYVERPGRRRSGVASGTAEHRRDWERGHLYGRQYRSRAALWRYMYSLPLQPGQAVQITAFGRPATVYNPVASWQLDASGRVWRTVSTGIPGVTAELTDREAFEQRIGQIFDDVDVYEIRVEQSEGTVWT